VNGNLLQWLQNFFTGRTHRTKVCASLSDQVNLFSGIVQGSGIGPIIFITGSPAGLSRVNGVRLSSAET